MTTAPDMNAAPLDGNATAGALDEVFTFEVTMARTTCASCGATSPVAELRAYTRAAGMVLRCASCDAVLVRLVRSADRAWLDLAGVRVLEMPMAERA
jgi:hypothetical protein